MAAKETFMVEAVKRLLKLPEPTRLETADTLGIRVIYSLQRQTGDVEGACKIIASTVWDKAVREGA